MNTNVLAAFVAMALLVFGAILLLVFAAVEYRMRAKLSGQFLQLQLNEWREAHKRWSQEKFRLIAERDRFREALEDIREQAENGRWPAGVARAALAEADADRADAEQ